MKNILKILVPSCALLLFCSCATPPPLTYLSLKTPAGKILTKKTKGFKESFPRGGMYFLNNNFRPAADIESYLEKAEKKAGNSILRNADINLNVPFAFDLLFFGYNAGTDFVTIKDDN